MRNNAIENYSQFRGAKMDRPGISARQVRQIKIGVGAGACLASSFGLQVAAAHAADAAENTVEGVTVTARPSIGAYTGTLQNTAQNVNVIPQQLMTDQAVSNVQDALKNVPGITLNAGEGGTHGDNINLRGFAASDDFFLDGLRDTGFYTRDSFNLDAIEVYKGPASTLFGRGSTGGVVNQVSKTAKLGNFASGTIAGGTNSEIRGTVDLNTQVSDTTAVRLNAMAQDAEVTGRDYVKNRRWGVAP